MEQVKNLGQIAMWFSGHLIFTYITVATLLGTNQIWEGYKQWRGVTFDVSALEDAEKAALAEQLIVDGFSVPKTIPRIK